MGLDTKKTCLWEGLQTTKAQTSLIFGQSDQRLCYSLLGKYHIYTCYERNLNFLASLCN